VRLTAGKSVTWNEPSAPTGITTDRVYVGPDPHGLGGFQVAVATAAATPSRQALRDLFSSRKGKTQVQLVVAVVHDGNAHLFGPDPHGQPIELPADHASRQLQSVLLEPDVLAATDRFAGFRKSRDSTGVPGFTNSGLFATHHILSNVPKRADWAQLGKQSIPLLGKRRKQLIEALGFQIKAGPNGTVLLSSDGHAPRAVAVLLDDSEQFDAKTQRFQLSPVAFGLAVATRVQAPWLVVLRKDQIRLYPGRDGVGIGSKGQAETYFEIDLSVVDSERAALLPLVFSARALEAGGSADELLRDSARYATELGERLRERIYDDIVPPVAVEVATRLAASANLQLDADGLATAYRVTLRILFRLLFQAYAEDRGLLPSGRNEGFDANSLKTNARRLLTSGSTDFGEAATIWFDLVQVWNAIDQGNPQWQIPAYNGGLFSTDPYRSPEGALIKALELPDSVLGPALRSLLIDVSDDGVLGPVDFRSLSVREFGTIYEGLLESSLSIAEEDLALDNSGAWIRAAEGDDVCVPSGTVYFHTASGERKSTGSYFTPKVVVDHLIERSIVPVLTVHLEKIATHLSKGDAAAAARDFFDFRVADLAMGSGHFLVAAVDKIEALMRTFLTEHTVPGISDELLRLAAVAKDALGSDDVAKSEVDQVSLLRRQVARRCIYGLDINPMAVELARLALWIHTFVPGLPMSNLDHGLANANSLTGIGTIDEALNALQPGRRPGEQSLFDSILTDELVSAKTLLTDVASASEASKAEVEQGARLLSEARNAADTARRIFDAAVAARVGVLDAGVILDDESLQRVLQRDEVERIAEALQPAHMPFLFPEVFLRERPGFDVLIGNPPWEEIIVDTDEWWGIRIPRLRGLKQKEKALALAQFRKSRPDLEAAFAQEQEHVRQIREALMHGPYPGLGSGNADLYQAFAWRNWQLARAGGRMALVLPRNALAGAALTPWRRTVLDTGQFASVCQLINTRRWVFPIHPQYSFWLTVVSKESGDRLVTWAGPFASEPEFLAGRNKTVSVPAKEFVEWGEGAAFPSLPDTESVTIMRKMKLAGRFDDTRTGWEFRPVQGDLNATTDKSLLEFDVASPRDRIPIVTGASFNIWDPDAAAPYAYATEKKLRQHLSKKLTKAVTNKRSAYFGLDFASGKLPFDRARIAFRDVTNQENQRTTIACLLPPRTGAVNAAPVLVGRQGGATEEAFLLGVLCSIPFDWASRRWVERHLNFWILNPLPVPVMDVTSAVCKRVIELAARLAAVDDRYVEWASEVGVPTGSLLADADIFDATAELDALVALLYELTEDEIERVFTTFHRGWDYSARLSAALKHYRAWKGKA